MCMFIHCKQTTNKQTHFVTTTVCVLYAFSKHEEQTLVRSEQANVRRKNFKGMRENDARHVVFSLNYTVDSFVLSVFFFSSSCHGNGPRLSSRR